MFQPKTDGFIECVMASDIFLQRACLSGKKQSNAVYASGGLKQGRSLLKPLHMIDNDIR